MCSRVLLFLISVFIFLNPTSHAADFKAIGKEVSDSVITAKITTAYAESKLLNPFKIFVSTDEGVVTLSGHVNDKKAYMEAIKIAKNTKGVKRIETDELIIKKVNTSFTDAYITAKVEASVLKAKVLDDESIPLVGINASTNNGIVTLTGNVPNKEAVSAIVKRASKVRGVKKVISKLQIKKSE